MYLSLVRTQLIDEWVYSTSKTPPNEIKTVRSVNTTNKPTNNNNKKSDWIGAGLYIVCGTIKTAVFRNNKNKNWKIFAWKRMNVNFFVHAAAARASLTNITYFFAKVFFFIWVFFCCDVVLCFLFSFSTIFFLSICYYFVVLLYGIWNNSKRFVMVCLLHILLFSSINICTVVRRTTPELNTVQRYKKPTVLRIKCTLHMPVKRLWPIKAKGNHFLFGTTPVAA